MLTVSPAPDGGMPRRPQSKLRAYAEPYTVGVCSERRGLVGARGAGARSVAVSQIEIGPCVDRTPVGVGAKWWDVRG